MWLFNILLRLFTWRDRKIKQFWLYCWDQSGSHIIRATRHRVLFSFHLCSCKSCQLSWILVQCVGWWMMKKAAIEALFWFSEENYKTFLGNEKKIETEPNFPFLTILFSFWGLCFLELICTFKQLFPSGINWIQLGDNSIFSFSFSGFKFHSVRLIWFWFLIPDITSYQFFSLCLWQWREAGTILGF